MGLRLANVDNKDVVDQWSNEMPILKGTVLTERTGASLSWMLWIVALALLVFGVSPAHADTVTLKSGEVLEGRILSETDTQLVIEASFYHGTIFSTREVSKSDIQSVVHESPNQTQEKADYEALAKFTLNPNQELTKNQYEAGIAAFEKFLTAHTNSSYAADIDQRLAEWRAGSSNVASGKVKYAAAWMTPDEKQAQLARDALQSLRKQLAALQVERAAQAGKLATAQKQLADAQSRLANISGGTAAGNQAGRHDLAGRLTAGVVGISQGAGAAEPASDSEQSQVQGEIKSYQQQVTQEQRALTLLDAKIAEVQSQMPSFR
jgi:hypothetical protein